MFKKLRDFIRGYSDDDLQSALMKHKTYSFEYDSEHYTSREILAFCDYAVEHDLRFSFSEWA